MDRLRSWFTRRRWRDDVEKELLFHLEQLEQELRNAGIPEGTARRQARMALGGREQITEQLRDAQPGFWVDSLRREIRDAWRGVVRTPGTVGTAIALIALVIGGNSTLFSMVHGLLTKPARGVHSVGLVALEPRTEGILVFGHSYADYLDYAAQSKTLARLIASDTTPFTLRTADGSYAFRGSAVTLGYFDVLGVHLVKGRSFTDNENRLDASGLVAIISHRVWQEQFHGIDDIAGQAIVLNGHPATIVGVAPPDFQGTALTDAAQVWVPLLAYARVDGTQRALADRGAARVFLIGQLTPGATISQAQAEFSTISTRLEAAYPATNGHRSVRIVPYSMTAGGNSVIASRGTTFLAVCSVIAMLTVLIVCANVANLMLARAAARQRETALRRSLGASRMTVVRALLFEGVLISMTAWAAAYLVAIWTSRAVVALFPPGAQGAALPLDFTPDWRVAAYGFVIALVATLAFTLPPAVRTWRQDVLRFLKAGEQGVVQGRTRLSNLLVVVQLACAVVLLTSAGLAYRSIYLIGARDLGFAPANLLLITVNTTGAATGSASNLLLLERIRERLSAAPRVRSVSYARSVPGMPGTLWQEEVVAVPGTPPQARAWINRVGPDYLRVFELTPQSGLAVADRRTTESAPVAMINQDLAEKLWPAQSPLGQSLQTGTSQPPVRVVGVVPNALFSGYAMQARPNFVFVSAFDTPPAPGDMSFYVRYDGGLDQVSAPIQRALRDVDARVPIVYMRTLTTELDIATWPVRFVSTLLALFAAASLIIAIIGQYAVIAFDIRRRTREFGVRMALGASSQRILGSVLTQGLQWSAVGLLLGLGLSVGAGQALHGVLFGITPTDGRTYAGVFGVLLTASLLGCYLPARRATRIHPMQALREE